MHNDTKYLLKETDPEYETIEKYYNDGYSSGYGWLNSNRLYAYNFKHPSEPKGYIPGGPIVWTHRYGLDGARQREVAWHNGWVDGINTYVTEHNLDFPQIIRK